MKGNVKFFNTMNKYGFIKAEDGKEYFVHESDVKDGVSLNENDPVVFEVEQGERGPKAVKVDIQTEDSGEEAQDSEEESNEASDEENESNEESDSEEPKKE
jgi:CspA family cold shock protein